MKFPELKLLICIGCNKKLKPWGQCLDCEISYSGYGISIYLHGFHNFCDYQINPNGNVFKKWDETLFNIEECEDFKEVMQKIHKLETFK